MKNQRSVSSFITPRTVSPRGHRRHGLALGVSSIAGAQVAVEQANLSAGAKAGTAAAAPPKVGVAPAVATKAAGPMVAANKPGGPARAPLSLRPRPSRNPHRVAPAS